MLEDIEAFRSTSVLKWLAVTTRGSARSSWTVSSIRWLAFMGRPSLVLEAVNEDGTWHAWKSDKKGTIETDHRNGGVAARQKREGKQVMKYTVWDYFPSQTGFDILPVTMPESKSWIICGESRGEIWRSINSFSLHGASALWWQLEQRRSLHACILILRLYARLTSVALKPREKGTPCAVHSSHQRGTAIRYCSFRVREEDCGCCVNISSSGCEDSYLELHFFFFFLIQHNFSPPVINQTRQWKAHD